jgi:hypothetical protein
MILVSRSSAPEIVHLIAHVRNFFLPYLPAPKKMEEDEGEKRLYSHSQLELKLRVPLCRGWHLTLSYALCPYCPVFPGFRFSAATRQLWLV